MHKVSPFRDHVMTTFNKLKSTIGILPWSLNSWIMKAVVIPKPTIPKLIKIKMEMLFAMDPQALCNFLASSTRKDRTNTMSV